MANIASMQAIAEKWGRVTPTRTPDYEAGVRSPRADWATNTANAEESWKQGVNAAATKGMFAKGVRFATSARWQRGAIEKGLARWGPGVTVAMPDYQRGFQPYRDAIEATTLPPRYPRRDPRNMARVEAIVKAMVQVKERMGGGMAPRGGGV